MKLYLTATPTPGRVRGLLRLLLARPDRRDDRRRLGTMFQPPPLRPAKAPTHAIDETLAALVELGLVREDDDVVVASPDLSLDRLPDVLAAAALKPEIHGEPNRFARTVGWFLAQPVGGVPAGYGAIKSALLAVRDKPGWDLHIDSDDRLDMVVYWAKYLGLLRPTRESKGEGLVPDPTTFLRRRLRELFPTEQPEPVQQFRERLGAICPVLDGGAVREQVLAAFGIAWPDNRLSSALAFALRRLRSEKLVEFGYFNDARPENFLLLGETERVTTFRGPSA
ncbi:MAG: protein DpdG [Gemmataceae bacterium]